MVFSVSLFIDPGLVNSIEAFNECRVFSCVCEASLFRPLHATDSGLLVRVYKPLYFLLEVIKVGLDEI